MRSRTTPMAPITPPSALYTVKKHHDLLQHKQSEAERFENIITGRKQQPPSASTRSLPYWRYNNTAVGYGPEPADEWTRQHLPWAMDRAATESNTLRLGQAQTTTFIAGVTGAQ